MNWIRSSSVVGAGRYVIIRRYAESRSFHVVFPFLAPLPNCNDIPIALLVQSCVSTSCGSLLSVLSGLESQRTIQYSRGVVPFDAPLKSITNLPRDCHVRAGLLNKWTLHRHHDKGVGQTY